MSGRATNPTTMVISVASIVVTTGIMVVKFRGSITVLKFRAFILLVLLQK